MAERTPVVVALADINADYSWNCRSKTRATADGTHINLDDGDTENPGIRGIADSFEIKGQDTPVDGYPDPKDSKKVRLVTGFRRFTAATLLAKDKKCIMGLPVGSIRVNMHPPMTEADARALNLRENVNRENLIGPDLAFGVRALMAADKSLTAKQIAASLGKGYSHINNLMKVATVKPLVFNTWRDAVTQAPTIAEMLTVAELAEDKQEAAYAALVAGKGEQTKGRNAWIATAVKTAKKTGMLLGNLERDGMLKLTPKVIFEDFVRNAVSFKQKVDGKKVSIKIDRKVADALSLGYQEGLKHPAVEEKEEDEGEYEGDE